MRPLEKKVYFFKSNSYIGTFLEAICDLFSQIVQKLRSGMWMANHEKRGKFVCRVSRGAFSI